MVRKAPQLFELAITGEELRTRLELLEALMDDWRPFWRWYSELIDLRNIAGAHFYRGNAAGRGHSAETRERRRAGLRRTDRSSDDYYQRFNALPTVRAGGDEPRYLWTGNTLRSTWQPKEFSKLRMRIPSERVELLASVGPSYRAAGGPFTDSLRQPYDLRAIDESLEERSEQYVTALFTEGQEPD